MMKLMFFKSTIFCLIVLVMLSPAWAKSTSETLQPWFDIDEAITLMRFCYTADLLLDHFSCDTKNPIEGDGIVNQAYPSPYQPVFPIKEWSYPPGETSWKNSVFITTFKNIAILAYNRKENKYALAFSGTNVFNVFEDLIVLMVTAGKLKIGEITVSNATYISDDYSTNTKAKIHLGFRLGLESFNLKLGEAMALKKSLPSHEKAIGYLEKGRPLIDAINDIKNGSILYVTGHSQGAAIAGLCAAWLKAEDIIRDKKLKFKCYTFASPRVGNDYFASSTNLALANEGFLVRVANNLDTIPQVPLTIQLLGDVNNPKMIVGLISQNKTIQDILVDLLAVKLPFPLDFRHIGVPFILNGKEPVVYSDTTSCPKECADYKYCFPAGYFPEGNKCMPVKDLDRQWWQHMPWTYLQLLKQHKKQK